MAPSSVASSAVNFHQDYSTFTSSKLARDGASWSSSLRLKGPHDNRPLQVETPTAQQSREFLQLRASAEKYNPNPRLRPQRSPAVPEAEMNTSKLANAFPGFSGVAEDSKPFSPNPFVSKANGHRVKRQSRVQPLQPKVRDENDVTIASDNHSSPTRLGNRNTRFGTISRPKTRQGPQPHLYKPAPGLVQNAAASTSALGPKTMAIDAQGSLTSLPIGSAQPTLNLPHGTNLTDLFSGVVRHPPPCTAQVTIRPRTSRFASAARIETAITPKSDEVPVPVDERHLLESIDVLQNRVAGLEIEKKALTSRQRCDSAVSIPDDASNDSKGQTAADHRVATENIRLETVVRSLEGQKDLLVRDVDVAETAVRNITQEVQQYYTRLSAAERNVQLLQAESNAISQERDQVISQLARAESEIETLSQENKSLSEENRKLKAQIALLTQTSAAKEECGLQHSGLGNSDFDNDEGPLDMDTISMMHQQQRINQHSEQLSAQDQSAPCANHSLDSSHNITYLSYRGDSSVCNVRQTLEQERKARQQLRQEPTAGNAGVYRVDNPTDAGAKLSREQICEPSMSSVVKRPKHSNISQNELTSGFIVPDITFDQRDIMGSQAPLPLPAYISPHPQVDQKNEVRDGTERSDNLNYAPIQEFGQPAHQAAEPRELPPISDEELDLTIGDEEPTVRPSQSPDDALATVLDSLYAENAALQAEKGRYETSYNRLDVSISRRQRNRLAEKCQSLLEACQAKADQIYNLRDVVEGRKQPFTQQQVDDTLHSLGLNIPFEGFSGRRRSTASSRSI
ncbi:MAG: hypothetical protein Q9207_002326 [Kuettlingeria erythrocarpa]